MSNLEDTVRSVVQDFISRDVLFTALDVSNSVKQSLPNARHREVRDVVRSIFTSDIESQGWARTPITVTLGDGTTADALLYHALTDSWDLDNKYSAQQRTATAYRPVAQAQATVAQAQSQAVTIPAAAPVVAPAPAPVPVPPARSLWDQMFQTQPSLFPRK
jgi:uncharacterized membrane protein